jgi:hypothetical protein
VSVFSVGPPSARIAFPAAGGTYALGQKVATGFSCKDAAYAPGIKTCRDSNGSQSPGQLYTSHTGKLTYTVTAVSKDGQKATRSITYTVVDGLTVGPVKVSGITAQVPLACHGTDPGGCQATLTLKTTKPANRLNIKTVGQGSATLTAGQSKTVTITVNATGQQLLAHRGSLQTKLIVTPRVGTVTRKVFTFHAA